MKNKQTHSPLDFEQLLLSKSYDSLTSEELSFVNQEVDSAKEYEELRMTLLSVKKIAQEENRIVADVAIKQALMNQMETKSTTLSLWDKIGGFLFPINTKMYKKPGFQFAVMSVLLLLVVNIGLNEFGSRKNELAINSNKKVKSIEIPEQKAIPEKEEVELIVEPMVQPQETVVEKEVFVEKLEEDVQEEVVILADEVMVDELKDKISVQNVTPVSEAQSRMQTDFYDDSKRSSASDMIAASDVVLKSKKQVKSIQMTSQSLADQEDMIDLLFVAL